MAQPMSQKKQQELQIQYSNYKNILQQLAQKIGDVEQETEEHKYENTHPCFLSKLSHRFFASRSLSTRPFLALSSPLPASRAKRNIVGSTDQWR
ncbi:Prefoldin beta-like protein [Lasiodiplodia theobromae]|nr:Prefoldin beta-like protein [Lasiodiplodia theobromae]